MSDIANRYRELRRRYKLNQKDFAALIGINQSSLSDIETGRTKPSLETLIATRDKFGVSIDWILFGEETNQNNPIINELNSLFKMLSESDQIDILNFVRIKVRY